MLFLMMFESEDVKVILLKELLMIMFEDPLKFMSPCTAFSAILLKDTVHSLCTMLAMLLWKMVLQKPDIVKVLKNELCPAEASVILLSNILE